jgi:hypothetical protein
VFSIAPSYVVGASKTEKSPSEKLNIAGIGIGGMGKGNLHLILAQMRQGGVKKGGGAVAPTR